mmetsp:Transcript_1092/g.1449  ORF Transcript_1092/g.1449 Transcript_1092/m.1449 type:complete len:84 (-) Transcript_1092:432-683(-)
MMKLQVFVVLFISYIMGYNITELMDTCQYINDTQYTCNQNCIICCDYTGYCPQTIYINATNYVDITVFFFQFNIYSIQKSRKY